MEAYRMVQAKTETKPIVINPIGVVKASDEQGSYCIEVFPKYREALLQLEQFSHVMIIWWADRHDNDKDRGLLSTELPYAPGVKAGVFACRSEYRPNPIGITSMPILAIDHKQGIITLPWIDAFDGTPVIDLKPYMPTSDRIRDVKVAGWLSQWPLWMEEAGAYFASHQTNFGC
ncbi:MAG: tRNA (N6-threonylcarbamoyladenosine(37)-N6)-methyltransferase TrmO [Anaerolinea sp.]|nr:tRNA (N6-threonylcarbamoyladenosine(37)-N6)-methyltransferase TrmO [Anaerolinea sp.]